jgi:hypothetical protein
MNNSLRNFFICLCGLLTILVMFRLTIFSHFSMVGGDMADGVADTSLMEHWYNFFRGKVWWNTVGYFAPYSDTLGYNDAYFLYGIIYSFFRLFNFDPFLSRQLVLIVLAFFGYFSFYFLARYLKYNYLICILCASLFVLSNNLQIHLGHSQLALLYFCPFIYLMAIKTIDSIRCNAVDSAYFYGFILAISLNLCLLTAYYIAWFVFLFFFIFGVIWLIIYHKEVKNYFNWKVISFIFIVFVIFFIPFFFTYLSTFKETGGHPLSELLIYTPPAWSFLNVGSDNLLFGYLYSHMHFFAKQIPNYEFTIGFSYFFIILVSIAIFINLKFKKNVVLSLTVLISLILMVKIGNFTLWKIIYYGVPGAKGLRVVARYAIFLNFPMTLLLLDLFCRIKNKSFILFVFVGLLILLGNINKASAGLDRKQVMAYYDSFPLIPKSCNNFFVLPKKANYTSDSAILNLYFHNVDAMYLSEKYAIRTLNGLSSFTPPTWNFSAFPVASYKERVYQYILLNKVKLNGLCSLDFETKTWDEAPL